MQEAGDIVYRDGSTEGYGRDASPLSPEVNFVRDVDFCSGVFLMARREMLNELEGFDEQFAPAYYEDTDLCVRIREAGSRVVFDPAVMVHHLEYGSAVSSRASEAEIGRARQLFARKHAAWVETRPARGEAAQLRARSADPEKKRVLFVEDTVPLRLIGSGFVRSNDILREMAGMGYAVTVYPLNGCPFDVAGVYADMPDSVEVMHDRSLEQFRDFLARRLDYYDIVWVARTHNLADGEGGAGHVYADPARIPPVVLDTEAIAALRDAEQAALEGSAFDLDTAIRMELRDGSFCRSIVAVNETEAGILRDIGLPDVSVIGHARTVRPTPLPFKRRAGMLFVGAIHRMDSPNYDSLCWLSTRCCRSSNQRLGRETRLTVVGYTGKDVSLERFAAHHRVTLRGPVTDLEPLYDQHRCSSRRQGSPRARRIRCRGGVVWPARGGDRVVAAATGMGQREGTADRRRNRPGGVRAPPRGIAARRNTMGAAAPRRAGTSATGERARGLRGGGRLGIGRAAGGQGRDRLIGAGSRGAMTRVRRPRCLESIRQQPIVTRKPDFNCEA